MVSTFLLSPSSSSLPLAQKCPQSRKRPCKAPLDTHARSRARGMVSETRKTTGKKGKPLTKGSEALGRPHSRHRERARGKNKQDFDAFFPTARPLSTNLQGASSRANTEHSPFRGERRRRGEGRKLATASAKEAARRRTVDGGRERRQSTGCPFFFFRCQRKREPLDFFLPSAAFFFLSRPPPVRSLSSRERRARTNNHFLIEVQEEVGKRMFVDSNR